MSRDRVCVIGAGLAGLTAAYELAKSGLDVVLLESEDYAGGLASSFEIGGLKIERFYHFVCRGDDDLVSLADELGLSNGIVWRRSKTAFLYEGRCYPFGTPIDLLRFRPAPLHQRVLFGLNIVQSRYRKNWSALDGISAKRWLIDRIGKRAYDVIWDPLIRVKFGDYHESISAAWIWHRINRVAASRRNMWECEQLGYLQGGSETLVRAITSRLESSHNCSVRFGTKVQQIITDRTRVRSVRLASGEVIPCAAVISTLALSALRSLVEFSDHEYSNRLSRIDYLGVVCGLLRLREPLTQSFWLNINHSRIPFNGVIEYSNLNADARYALGGGAVVYIPYYLRTNCKRYRMNDAALREEFIEALPLVNPRFRPNWVEDFRISRATHAQAICTVGFAALIPDHRSMLPGLYLTDSSQYYPEDRSISAAIRLGRRVAGLVEDDLSTHEPQIRSEIRGIANEYQLQHA